jgi:hypothetical protein
MRSVFYIEEDFIVGLLKNYFSGNNKTSQFLRRGSNGTLAHALSKDSVDFFVAQSEDPERLTKILETVRKDGKRVPTLVLTSHSDKIPDELRAFAHFVPVQELLESKIRWHIRLAKTMRRLEEVRAHFDSAESILILLQDDPDPDAIASGLALRQVLGRNKQTAPIGSFGRVTRPATIRPHRAGRPAAAASFPRARGSGSRYRSSSRTVHVQERHQGYPSELRGYLDDPPRVPALRGIERRDTAGHRDAVWDQE